MKKISRLFFGLFLILTLCITGFACAKEPAKHTVTFMNGTTQYEQVNVTENTAVTAPSTNPTKESNVQYSYTFDGWYNGETEWDFTTPVTGNLTLTAKYTQTVNEYAVTFKNEDGSVFSTSSVAYGTVITLPETNPTKNSDTQYSYTFAGWDGYIAGMTVNGNKEFTATYSNNVNTYTITFKNEDGTVYNSYSKNYGEEITLPAINPTKSATAQYTYTFAGWTGYTDGMTVSGNVEFIANFMSTVNKYTVTFKNEDGSVFQTLEVNYGTMAGIPATSPSKDKHAFSYWATISGAQYNFNTPVTENVDLYPIFIKTVEEFTVTFTVDGVVYATVTVEQGTAIGALAPANPTKESTETIAYTFDYWRNGRTRWDIENGIVNKNITLTAKFNETPIVKPVVYYTVSFVASGEIVKSYQFKENTTAV